MIRILTPKLRFILRRGKQLNIKSGLNLDLIHIFRTLTYQSKRDSQSEIYFLQIKHIQH